MTRKKKHLEIVSLEGEATPEQRAAIAHALERLRDEERRSTAPSMWLRAGRAQGRRLGNLDYRDRFNRGDAWRLSTRFAFGGREYPGLHGRADAK